MDEINKEYVSLIRRGRHLLDCIKRGDLQIEIHLWIIEATDHILPFMPTEISDYQVIKEIRQQYEESKLIIPGEIFTHVSKVIEHLLHAHGCFNLGSIGKYEDIPTENLACISYDLIKQLTDYVKNNLVNQLIGKEDGRTKKTALLHTYGQILCWMESIINLSRAVDYQAIASCTRAILELFIDMHLLYKSNEQIDIERYFSFPDVSKWKTAKKITNLREEYKLTKTDYPNPDKEFLSETPNKENQIELLREKLWGKTRKGKIVQPQHWKNLVIVDRVKKINNKQVANTYLSTYYYCNWSVHPGYSVFPGRKEEDAHLFNYYLYSLCNEMFTDSSTLLNNEIQILDGAKLQKEFEKIRQASDKKFWGELANAALKKK